MALCDYLNYLELPEYPVSMDDHVDTLRAVMRLASERPDWIPVVRAACEAARTAENYDGEFAGAWVLSELEKQTGIREWRPGLRTLATYGLLEKSGPSARGGRRAYYRMPDRQGVERGLQELERRRAGRAPSPAEILDAVRELHTAGQNKISPLQALEHLSPGYTDASKAADIDLVFPTVVHIFEQAGRDGVLPIEGTGSEVLAVFPAGAGT